jgi:hypothetical protein
MGETNVEIGEFQKEPCLLYCAIVANAATGKSNGLSILRKAIRDIEIYNKIDIKDSKVINGNFLNLTIYKK